MSVSNALFSNHWLKRYGLSKRAISIISVFWIVVGILLNHTNVGDYLESKIAAPINFHIRDAIGYSPVQNSKLKIFGLDDKTFSWLGSPMPDLKLWGDILDGIAESKPKLIVVDAMLSSRPTDTPEQIKFYFSRLKELNVPVALGAFTSESELPFKTKLNTNQDWYQIKSYYPDKDVVLEGRGMQSHVPAWPVHKKSFAYGPAAELNLWFSHIGHFQLFNEHKVAPFLRVSDETVIPHISMFAADSIKFENGNLRINDRRVALDRSGAIEVDFIPTRKWKVESLGKVIKDVKDGYAPNGVSEGDIVLILPFYYTGNTDFRPSPFGLMPGGLYIASMLNSIVSNEWLQPVLASEMLTVALVGTSAFLIFSLSTSGFWVFAGLTCLSVFILSQFCFSIFGLVIPWLHPTFVFAAASINFFALKMRANERKVITLRAALDGAIAPTQLESILKSPETVNLEPRERVVTLMFIDVVGFSLVAENLLPRIAFDSLKKILGSMASVVHSYGGVVDKSLGDGLLCYFGYRFGSDVAVSDHAEMAFRCATKIQEMNILLSEEAHRFGKPMFPLRIGINTASCYMGDLGTENRIEFTVVGNGVNFAKRLEGACLMNSVLIGATTWELIKGIDIEQKAISKKLVRIKHHKELVDAYEYDPLFDRTELRMQISDAFRKLANLQRLDERIQIREGSVLRAQTDSGQAQLINFSGTGVSISLKTPVPKGSIIKISFDSLDGLLKKRLTEIAMASVDAEVRWSYQAPSGFVHGLAFLSVDEELSEKFLSIMYDFAFINSAINSGEVA